MIEQSTIDRIFATVNIVDIVGEFVALKRNGANYKACCPFHNEKTPSFVVSPAKGLYKCFGCGKGGNAVSFVMEHEGLNYADALKYIASKYNIEVVEKELSTEQIQAKNDREGMMVVNNYAYETFKEALHNSEDGRAIALSYFQERGISEAMIERFGLGFAPIGGDTFTLKALKDGYSEDFLVKTGLTIRREQGGFYDRFSGRVMFPIHSLSGRVIAFGGRTLRTDKKVAKYLNSPESEVYHKGATLYGLFQAKKSIVEKNLCILVEGYLDVISMVQSGVENVVASSGTALTTEQIKLISRFTKNVTVIYDGDSAGIKASLRGVDMLLSEGLNVRVVSLEEGEDPDTFAKKHSSQELQDYILNNEVDFITFKANLLLAEVKGDPIGRSTVIKEVVDSIAVIPDEISRYQYIKECSKLLDTDEQVIAREVMRRVNDAIHGVAGRDIFRNQQNKEAYLRRKEQQKKEVIENFDPLTSLYNYERELLSYLLKYGDRFFFFEQRDEEGHLLPPIKLNVAETIIDELAMDAIVFTNSTYNTILHEYISTFRRLKGIKEQHKEAISPDSIIEKVYSDNDNSSDNSDDPELSEESSEEGIKVDLDNFVNNPDPKVCNFVVDLMTSDEGYRPSKIWSKFGEDTLIEEDKLDIAVPKCIGLYKSDVIRNIISSKLQIELETASEEGIMDILRDIQIYNEIRKNICLKYNRFI